MFTVREIANALGAEAAGNLDLRITRAAEPQEATADALAMAMSPKYAEALKDGAARVALVWEGADWQAMGLEAAVFVTRPRLAMSGVRRGSPTGRTRASSGAISSSSES